MSSYWVISSEIKNKSFYCNWIKYQKIWDISAKLEQIPQHDAWLFPELRNNGAALYTLFTVAKICRQMSALNLKRPAYFPTIKPKSSFHFKGFATLLHLSNIFFHLTSSLPYLPPSQVSLSVVLPHMASSFVSIAIVVCLNHFSLLISSPVLCTSMEVFLAPFWMMCWPTLLHPARPFLTPSRVLLLAPGFAAIGSSVDVWPGSQDHQSRLFLLLSALNLPVCYPGALTPTCLFTSF